MGMRTQRNRWLEIHDRIEVDNGEPEGAELVVYLVLPVKLFY